MGKRLMICLLVLMLTGCRRETIPVDIPETDRTVSAEETGTTENAAGLSLYREGERWILAVQGTTKVLAIHPDYRQADLILDSVSGELTGIRVENSAGRTALYSAEKDRFLTEFSYDGFWTAEDGEYRSFGQAMIAYRTLFDGAMQYVVVSMDSGRELRAFGEMEEAAAYAGEHREAENHVKTKEYWEKQYAALGGDALFFERYESTQSYGVSSEPRTAWAMYPCDTPEAEFEQANWYPGEWGTGVLIADGNWVVFDLLTGEKAATSLSVTEYSEYDVKLVGPTVPWLLGIHTENNLWKLYDARQDCFLQEEGAQIGYLGNGCFLRMEFAEQDGDFPESDFSWKYRSSVYRWDGTLVGKTDWSGYGYNNGAWDEGFLIHGVLYDRDMHPITDRIYEQVSCIGGRFLCSTGTELHLWQRIGDGSWHRIWEKGYDRVPVVYDTCVMAVSDGVLCLLNFDWWGTDGKEQPTVTPVCLWNPAWEVPLTASWYQGQGDWDRTDFHTPDFTAEMGFWQERFVPAEMPEIPMSGICLTLLAVEWDENGGLRYAEELTLVYDRHRDLFGMYSRPGE